MSKVHGIGHKSTRLSPAQVASNKATPVGGGTPMPKLHGQGTKAARKPRR